jgi:hypothetical protein
VASHGYQNDNHQIDAGSCGETKMKLGADNGEQCNSNAPGQTLTDCSPQSVVLILQHADEIVSVAAALL